MLCLTNISSVPTRGIIVAVSCSTLYSMPPKPRYRHEQYPQNGPYVAKFVPTFFSVTGVEACRDTEGNSSICSQDHRAEPNFLTILDIEARWYRVQNTHSLFPQILPKKISSGASHSSSISVPNPQGVTQSTNNLPRGPTHQQSTSNSHRNERLQRRRILAIWIRVRLEFSLSEIRTAQEEFA